VKVPSIPRKEGITVWVGGRGEREIGGRGRFIGAWLSNHELKSATARSVMQAMPWANQVEGQLTPANAKVLDHSDPSQEPKSPFPAARTLHPCSAVQLFQGLSLAGPLSGKRKMDRQLYVGDPENRYGTSLMVQLHLHHRHWNLPSCFRIRKLPVVDDFGQANRAVSDRKKSKFQITLRKQTKSMVSPLLSAFFSSLHSTGNPMSETTTIASKRKLRPARKQVKAGDIDKTEGPQPGKEYSEFG